MAGLIDDRQEEYEELDKEVEVDEVVDNDEGIDLDGDQDEEIDADTELEEESFEYDEVDESENLDEQDGNEDEEEQKDGTSDEEINQDEETQISEKDAKIAELQRQREVDAIKYAKLENQVKDALEKLGVPVNGNVLEVLDRVEAEAEGKTLEEYQKEKNDKTEIAIAKSILIKQRFAEVAASDLSEIKKSFPNLLKVNNIKDCFNSMEEFAQFGKLRDAGVAPKNAYMAVKGETVQQPQKKLSDGKRHITSVAPKKASDTNIVMPKETLREWRDNFPELSDAEIRKLYKETL